MREYIATAQSTSTNSAQAVLPVEAPTNSPSSARPPIDVQERPRVEQVDADAAFIASSSKYDFAWLVEALHAHAEYVAADRLDLFRDAHSEFLARPLWMTSSEYSRAIAREPGSRVLSEPRGRALHRLSEVNAEFATDMRHAAFQCAAFRLLDGLEVVVGGQSGWTHSADAFATVLCYELGVSYSTLTAEESAALKQILHELHVERERLKSRMWHVLTELVEQQRAPAIEVSALFARDGRLWMFEPGADAELDALLNELEQEYRWVRARIGTQVREAR